MNLNIMAKVGRDLNPLWLLHGAAVCKTVGFRQR